jgi:hypothetical protein
MPAIPRASGLSPAASPSVVLATALAVLVCSGCSQAGSAAPGGAAIHRDGAEVSYPQLAIDGRAAQSGSYDPALEYDEDERGWLAYSSVPYLPDKPYTHTHLATSEDHGASWSFVGEINHSFDDTIVTEAGSRSGAWRYEVPTLVHDEGDAGKEWKLFVHRHFWNAIDDRMPQYGWIAYRHAAQPGGPWSAEIPLFGSGAWPLAPYHVTLVDVNALHADLAANLAYTEPGSLVWDGTLYVSLVALRADGPESVVILASDDHGQQWRYVGTALTNRDARAFGYVRFDGSSLTAHGGDPFLMVTAVDDTGMNDGTFVFRFADIASGAVLRSGGRPRLHLHIPIQRRLIESGIRIGGGQSSYHELNTGGGVLMPQFDAVDVPLDYFRIFSTGVMLGSPTPAAAD